jgi:hypothetical protein
LDEFNSELLNDVPFVQEQVVGFILLALEGLNPASQFDHSCLLPLSGYEAYLQHSLGAELPVHDDPLLLPYASLAELAPEHCDGGLQSTDLPFLLAFLVRRALGRQDSFVGELLPRLAA